MDQTTLREEQANLDETLVFLRRELQRESAVLMVKRDDLKALNQHMWADYSTIAPGDDERYNELAQLLSRFNQTAHSADNAASIKSKYEKLLISPYFGRFDIAEKGLGEDTVYVGFHNLFDLKSGRIYIYDWRSPIASVFYRYELGPCHYDSPDGRIEGTVLLKRQLKIADNQVKFYTDSGLVIRDEVLLEALSQNSTPKMRTIVETIQKEQDLIIRDLTNDVLLVSGSAGSGKTSIALHRVAYLLYESKITKATSKNVMILSPNGVFADYVDHVLPDLGEEQVKQITIDELHSLIIPKADIQTKNSYLENLMRLKNPAALAGIRRRLAFKTSHTMASLMDRYALLYERRLHKFADVMLHGRLLFTANQLKALFLDNEAKLPAQARLRRIYDRIKADAEPVFDEIRLRMKDIVYNSQDRVFEEEAYLDKCIAEMKNRFYKAVRKQTFIDPCRLYYNLTADGALRARLSKNLQMPEDAGKILAWSRAAVATRHIPFEDAGALMYFAQRLCGVKAFNEARHVVIDEAQDYGPINYLCFKRLLKNARFTILGDSFQTVGKKPAPDFMGQIAGLLDNPRTAHINLTKSYRSSKEIHRFCARILGGAAASETEGFYSEAFDRSGEEPKIHIGERKDLLTLINREVMAYAGHSTAILTKTAAEAGELSRFIEADSKALITSRHEKLSAGLNIMPVYLAKGLEFDFVMVWGADNLRYSAPSDRYLLYVACTRALHRLALFAEGTASRFLT
ncbi:MAG: AAA family ATPase [Clostridiales bacterium]|jgi:DNA helicase-2/ATP-dependent DNA helicase PcrA|nr:AAA family ATPase [Clostridiales bacterium]